MKFLREAMDSIIRFVKRRVQKNAFGVLMQALFWIGACLSVGWLGRYKGIEILGGIVPGWLVVLGLGITGISVWFRFGRQQASVRRKRKSRSYFAVLVAIKVLLLGSLVGTLFFRVLNPVQSNKVFVVVGVLDEINDKDFREELLLAVENVQETYKHKDIEFVGTPALQRIAQNAKDGKLGPGDSIWWKTLVQQESVDLRLANLAAKLSQRYGDQVVVIAVDEPDERIATWPLSPDRIGCRWISVDPATKPRADRTQLINYTIGQDAAADNSIYLTLSVRPGEPAPIVIVRTDADETKVESSGKLGDYYGYFLRVPRSERINEIRFQNHDGSDCGIGQLSKLDLAQRKIHVFTTPEWKAVLGKLPIINEPDGPIEFVNTPSDADVVWAADVTSYSQPTVKLIESAPSIDKAPKGYELVRTAAYISTPLGQVALPNIGNEMFDFSKYVTHEPIESLFIGLSRDGLETKPFVFRAQGQNINSISIISPNRVEFNGLTENSGRSVAYSLIWSSSLVLREGRRNPPPQKSVTLIDRNENHESPLDSGPKCSELSLWSQILKAVFAGQSRSRIPYAKNALRPECASLFWWSFALLLVVSVASVVADKYVNPFSTNAENS